jgi:hypothetical protein
MGANGLRIDASKKSDNEFKRSTNDQLNSIQHKSNIIQSWEVVPKHDMTAKI